MYSRAHLLIERDYETLQKEQPWGIEAHPLKNDNIFEWMVKIWGLQGTLWEGGIFRLYLKFDENYNYSSPEICFHTIPFHPNVEMITGKPCVDFLDDKEQWREGYSLSFILMSLQTLLSNPVLESAVNTEAAYMLNHSPASYRQIVSDCVAASQRVEAGLTPHLGKEKVSFGPSKENLQQREAGKTPSKKVSRISFEDYHTTWSGIATSKSHPKTKNPLLEAIKDNPTLQAAHFGLPAYELHQQMNRQMEDHTTLMYGKFKTKPTEDELRQAKMDQVSKMRKIYLHSRTPRKTPPVEIPPEAIDAVSRSNAIGRGETSGDEEEWEEEVDGLVAWTNQLDVDNL